MKRATMSTHVLDVSLGKPAEGVGVTLLDGDQVVGEGVTGSDGRIAELAPGGVAEGQYRLVFAVGDYFGERPHLYETVIFDVNVADDRQHHVPLLIGPYSCSSYRGS
jgi:5-hydroxyisourate hydrolase